MTPARDVALRAVEQATTHLASVVAAESDDSPGVVVAWMVITASVSVDDDREYHSVASYSPEHVSEWQQLGLLDTVATLTRSNLRGADRT